MPPLEVEIEFAADGRWIGRVPALVGVEYPSGMDEQDALDGVLIQAFQFLAERIRCNEPIPEQIRAVFAPCKVQLG